VSNVGVYIVLTYDLTNLIQKQQDYVYSCHARMGSSSYTFRPNMILINSGLD